MQEVHENEIMQPCEVAGSGVISVESSSVINTLRCTGISTAFTYDTAEVMDMEYFTKNVLPGFKESGKYAVLTDGTGRRTALLKNDSAVVFHVTGAQDFPSGEICEHIQSDAEICIVPQTGAYKLIRYRKSQQGDLAVVLEIPESRFIFHHHYSALARWKTHPVWHPTLWMNLMLNESLAVLGVNVVIAPDTPDGPCKLLTLPNIGRSNGSICFGSTYVEGAQQATTIGAVAFQVYHQIFDSYFNYDLFNSDGAVRAVRESPEATELLKGVDHHDALDSLLWCMESPQVMRTLRWPETAPLGDIWS